MLSYYKCFGEFFDEDEDFAKDIEQAIDTSKTVPELITTEQERP